MSAVSVRSSKRSVFSLLRTAGALALLAAFLASGGSGLAAYPSVPHAPPPYQWHSFFGSVDTDTAYWVCRDGDGNLIVAGYSETSWNGPGGQAPLHPHSSGRNPDLLVLKLDRSGAYLWHTFYGSASGDFAKGAAADQDGNLYLAGYSASGWNGDGGAEPLHAYTAGNDLSVLKLDPNGGYLWHTFYGQSGSDVGYALQLDALGGVYITGRSSATWNGPGGIPPKHAWDMEMLVLKLDSAGNYLWHTFYRGLSLYPVMVDDAGLVYIGGYTDTVWNGPSGELARHAYAGGSGSDMELIVLHADGAYAWHTYWGSTQDDINYSLALDRDKNVYLVGSAKVAWQGPADTQPLHAFSGPYDIAVIALDKDGAYRWHTFYYMNAHNSVVTAVKSVDESNSLMIASTSDASWVGPGPTDPLHAYTGGTDFALLELDFNGAYRWHTFYGSSAAEYTYGLFADGKNDILLAGYSAADWQGPGGANARHPYTGGLDATLLKFSYFPLFMPAIQH